MPYPLFVLSCHFLFFFLEQDDGAPVVHAVKESSIIADKIKVGDKLVAVDDEDVRSMTAIKVSKLISRKSSNPTRKLTVIRTSVVEG